MLKIDVDQKDEKTVICMRGKATIENAEQIKNRFLEVLKESSHITVSVSELEKADISFLQVIQSLYVSCRNKNIEFDFTSMFLSKAVLDCLYTHGLFDQMTIWSRKREYFNGI